MNEIETMKDAIKKLAGLYEPDIPIQQKQVDNIYNRLEKIEPPEIRNGVKERIQYIVHYIC